MQYVEDFPDLAAGDDALRRFHSADIGMTGNFPELASDVRRSEADVDRSRHYGAARHSLVRRRFVLRERDAAGRLDLVQPERPVTPRARQDDRNRLMALSERQRFEEHVDRVMPAIDHATRQQFQRSVRDDHATVRRNHVDAIRRDFRLILDFIDGHSRRAGQDLGEMGCMGRRKVRDEHERHAGVGRQRAEQLSERLEAAGRGADADDRKGESRLVLCLGVEGVYFGLGRRAGSRRRPPTDLLARRTHRMNLLGGATMYIHNQSNCFCRACGVRRARRTRGAPRSPAGRHAWACESQSSRRFPCSVLCPSPALAVNHQPRTPLSALATTKRRPSLRMSVSPLCGIREPCAASISARSRERIRW